MTVTANFTNHFLIAMPTLADPNFSRSLTLICEHNPDGALGVIVNRPMEVSLGELLAHMDIHSPDQRVNHVQVYSGGPVQVDRGFILHEPVGSWESTLAVGASLGLTTSRDIISAIAAGQGPRRCIVALGYAGWGAGQLEQEMAENAWLTTPADASIIFEQAPEHRWQAAAGKLGIDLNLLAGNAGHA